MKVFHPIEELVEFVDATCGQNAHPEGTRYRVAVGRESWNGQSPLVVKVQLVSKESGVLGRRSPSFPLHSDDFRRVNLSVQQQLIKAENLGMKVGCKF
jgi:hypothetical protein